jgi:hypothetical protein
MSAVATLTEYALTMLTPHLNDIIQTLVHAFQLYQTKNFRILYDAIGTLAWAVGWEMDKPQYVEALMVPIMQRFENIPDNDLTIVPLFECCSHLVQHLGSSLVNVVPRFVQRCTRTIQDVGRLAQMWEQNPNEYEQPDHELMATSIDLLAGIIEGFAENSAMIIQQNNFVVILPDVLRCRSPRVKQSGFALMGSAATHCLVSLQAILPTLLPLCATGLAPGMTTMVSHNASWAIGEVCVRVGPEVMNPHIEVLLSSVVEILHRKDGIDFKPWQRQGHRALLGNICITIGRLGLGSPDVMAKHLPNFLMPWCIVMRSQRLDKEKIRAFEGMCNMLRVNPMAGMQCFPFLAGAIAYMPPLPNLAGLRELLQGYKNQIGANWPQVFNGFQQDVKDKLQNQWQIGDCPN